MTSLLTLAGVIAASLVQPAEISFDKGIFAPEPTSFSVLDLQDQKFSLWEKPVVGNEITHKLGLTIDAMGQEIKIEMRVKRKITKVGDKRAYESENTLLGGTMNAMGQEQAMPEQAPQKAEYDENGKPKEKTDLMQAGPFGLISYVTEYEPKEDVKVGDTWKVEEKDHDSEFKLEGKETFMEIKCVKLTVKLTMKGDASGSGTGTIWLAEDTFALIGMDGKFDAVKPNGEAPPLNIAVNLRKSE